MAQQRSWGGWVLWGGIGICLALSGAVVAHHYAPLYAPGLVIAWSPSTDHITRAMLVEAADNPAGCDSAWLRDATRRCGNAELARLFRSGDSGAIRAGMALGARIDQPGSEGASARAVVSRLLTEEPAERVAGLIQTFPRGHSVTIALVAELIEHPHPFVAQSAIQALSGDRSRDQLRPQVIAALRRTLAGRARDPTLELRTADAAPGPMDWNLHFRQLAGYRPMFPTRAMTAVEVDEWEAGTRRAAWRALGQNHPDIACAEARTHWDRLSEEERKHVIRSLSESDERAVGFLTEIAIGTDVALAQFATLALACLCEAGTQQGSADPGIAEAFVAFVDLVFREPGRRSEVEKQDFFSGLAPQVVDRIAAQLPSDHRALALDLLDARQSAALRACFDQPTATPP